MRTRPKPFAAALLCLTLLAGGYYLTQGGWMMLSPTYDQRRLLGLTRGEVVQRLGPPSFDPRAAPTYTTRPWADADDGQDYLGYYQGQATCSITFKDGKVDSVQRFWK
jgi:hypothetical protein